MSWSVKLDPGSGTLLPLGATRRRLGYIQLSAGSFSESLSFDPRMESYELLRSRLLLLAGPVPKVVMLPRWKSFSPPLSAGDPREFLKMLGMLMLFAVCCCNCCCCLLGSLCTWAYSWLICASRAVDWFDELEEADDVEFSRMAVVVPRWPLEGATADAPPPIVAIAGGWCWSRLFTLASRCEFPFERLLIVSWAFAAVPARFGEEPSPASSSSLSSSVHSELRLLLRLRLMRFPFESWESPLAVPLAPFVEGSWRLARPPREAFV